MNGVTFKRSNSVLFFFSSLLNYDQLLKEKIYFHMVIKHHIGCMVFAYLFLFGSLLFNYQKADNKIFICKFSIDTRGYQKVLSLTWKDPEIWIYSALFFNVVPFQLHTLVPSSFPVINTRSVEVNILVP